jgi:quinol monooxygenase YgiN
VARREPGVLEQLASELTAAVRSGEPGVLTYRWSRVADSDAWLIEEEYADSEAFAHHMERMGASGDMRRLGKALRVDRVLVLAGDHQAVSKHLGPLPQVVYSRVEEL